MGHRKSSRKLLIPAERRFGSLKILLRGVCDLRFRSWKTTTPTILKRFLIRYRDRHRPMELSAVTDGSCTAIRYGSWPLATCGYWALDMWLVQLRTWTFILFILMNLNVSSWQKLLCWMAQRSTMTRGHLGWETPRVVEDGTSARKQGD